MIASPDFPLADWADGHLQALAAASGSAAIGSLTGAGLLGERAMLNGFTVPGMVSAGGGCRFYRSRDGWVALNLSRPDDRDLLPALFQEDLPDSENAVAARIARCQALPLVARGRDMGLAIAAVDEPATGPAWTPIVEGGQRQPVSGRPPLVVDLSALWAGPLAAHLMWNAGAQVVKVESRTRPDAMRDGDPALFALLNQGKASVALDFRDAEERRALIALLSRADIVIEAARPRALAQLGIDANAIVGGSPGLVWMTITGHGVESEAANHVGFGDDCGVAGGLSMALLRATGTIGFVGDAIADPLTGILTARLAWDAWVAGRGGRTILSMSGTVREALREALEKNSDGFDKILVSWGKLVGRAFPDIARRSAAAPTPLGRDTARWTAPPC